MAKARGAGDQPLSFPNPSRSYDDSRHGVRFWGYDRTFEVSFLVEDEALEELNPDSAADEHGHLGAFDLHRDQIRSVAERVYTRRGKTSHIFSFILTTADL